MKSKEEKKLSRIVFFVCLLVLALMFKTFGQVHRFNKYPDNPKIVTICPDNTISYKHGKETVTFSAFLDSLPNGQMFAYVYAYFPKSFKGYDNKITVGFSDETSQTLNVNYVDASDPNGVYVEYLIPANKFKSFLHDRYTYIYVENVKQFITIPPNGYFFTDFFMSMAFGK